MPPPIRFPQLPHNGFKPIGVQQKEARLRAVFEKGLRLHEGGEVHAARQAYESILAEEPRHFDALHLLGVVCAQMGEHQIAVDLLSKAVHLNKSHAVAHNNLGNAQAELKNWHAALESYNQAVKLNPRYALAYFNRGIPLEELGNFDAALATYQKAIQIDADYSQAYSNCGLLLQKFGRISEAMLSFDHAIRADPSNAEAFSNRGNVYREINRYSDSIADFDRAISIRPEFADAYWNKSLSLLYVGSWAAAWDIYDWRWRRSDIDPQAFQPPLEAARLQRAVKASPDQSVFIWSEQGVGDEVFHASMLNEAAMRFGSVTVQVDGRLIPLLQRSIHDVHFLDKAKPVDSKLFDIHLAHGDLGYFFRKDETDLQRIRQSYLQADRSRVVELRAFFQSDERPLVGITWRSKNKRLGSGKSISLENLLPVLRNPALRFVDLQYGDTTEELQTLRQQHGIDIGRCPAVDNFFDLDGHAALVEVCDMVLTVSNTTAHIAGALGKPTYVMLSKGEGRLW